MKFLLEYNEFNSVAGIYFSDEEISDIENIVSDFLRSEIEFEMPEVAIGDIKINNPDSEQFTFTTSNRNINCLSIRYTPTSRVRRLKSELSQVDTDRLEKILSDNINDIYYIDRLKDNGDILLMKKEYFNFLNKICTVNKIIDDVVEEIEYHPKWTKSIFIENNGTSAYRGGENSKFNILIGKKHLVKSGNYTNDSSPIEFSFIVPKIPGDIPTSRNDLDRISFQLISKVQSKFVVDINYQKKMESVCQKINDKKYVLIINTYDSQEDVKKKFIEFIEENLLIEFVDDKVKDYERLIKSFNKLKEYNINFEYENNVFTVNEINYCHISYKGKEIDIEIQYTPLDLYNSRSAKNIYLYKYDDGPKELKLIDKCTIDEFPETIFLFMMDKVEESTKWPPYQFNVWDSEEGKEVIEILTDYFYGEFDEQPKLKPCKVMIKNRFDTLNDISYGKGLIPSSKSKRKEIRMFYATDGQEYKWHDPEINGISICDPAITYSRSLKLTKSQNLRINSLINNLNFTCISMNNKGLESTFIMSKESWEDIKNDLIENDSLHSIPSTQYIPK